MFSGSPQQVIRLSVLSAQVDAPTLTDANGPRTLAGGSLAPQHAKS